MFRTRGFIFRKTVVYTGDVRQHRTHSSNAACKMYHTLTVYTTIFLKMNSRFWFEHTLLPTRPLILMHVNTYHTTIVSRVSSVGITTRYVLDGPGIESRCGRDFPHLSRQALRPTQGPAARPWRWPPTPSSVEVKERVQLYLYSPCRPSWPVLGWNLPLLYFTT
jgi:hypothetical protein